MPLLDVFTTFVNATAMDPDLVGEVFIKTATERGIYNVLHEIDSANISLTPNLREDTFQFNPYPNAGGHNHDLDNAGFGAPLASGSVTRETVDRPASSLIYTGDPDIMYNQDEISVTVANRVVAAVNYGYFGHTDVTLATADYPWNAVGFLNYPWTNTIIGLFATVRGSFTDKFHLFVELLDQSATYRVWVVGTAARVYTVQLQWYYVKRRA